MGTGIVTGANGFIGARVVLGLLRRGWKLYALGRAKSGTAWRDRMRAALTDIAGRPVSETLLSALSCIPVDICMPDARVLPASPPPGGTGDVVLFHIAGDTRFAPPDVDAQRLVNVTGAMNVIRLLRRSVTAVVHMSTAYVAGNRQGVVLETDGDAGQSFRNSYERTKLEAEIAVAALCRELEIPLTVIRPSIVINDSVTGRSSALTHFNAVFDVVGRIRRRFARERRGAGTEFRVPVHPDGQPNLIPVDVLVELVLQIGLDPRARGKTCHLCHPAPQTNRELLPLIVQALALDGRMAIRCEPGEIANASRAEETLRRALGMYLPYLNESRSFDMTNSRAVVAGYDSLFEPITVSYLRKIIDSAESRTRQPPCQDRHAVQEWNL